MRGSATCFGSKELICRMQTILRWVVGVISILITVWAAHQLSDINTAHHLPAITLAWKSALGLILFVPLMAVVNAVIRPVIKLIALPINCLTFGLFSFIVNAVLFWAVGHLTRADMNVLGALFGSICYAALSTILSWPIKENDA